MSKTNTLRIFVIRSSRCIIRNIHSCESNKQEVDAMDEFTTQLVQKKSGKWDNIRNKVTKNCLINTVAVSKIFNEKDLNILQFNTKQIDDLFSNALELNDINKIKEIIGQCIYYNLLPTFKIADRVVSFCSKSALKNTIDTFNELIAKKYPNEYRVNSNFKHYLAEVYWLRGNITRSLQLFDDVYVNNVYLRKKVKFMVRFLIINIVTQNSEAALVAVTQFTGKIAQKYDDYYLLSIVWQNCFLSDWFADQCTATNLLEKHRKLTNIIEKKIPFILHVAIKEHKPEILNRLMEVLLKYEMKGNYSRVLQTLFDYRYRNNDLRSCGEIVQWSLNLEVPLANLQHEQFLSLLLGRQFSIQEKESKLKSTDSTFQLKF